MASIYDLLAGNVGGNAEYYSADPYYIAGRGILGLQAKPTNSTEAFLGPILQGLAGGGLMGYGQSSAADQAFLDAKNSISIAPLLQAEQSFTGPRPEGYEADPLIAKYLGAEAPEGFTPNIAKADQLRALLQGSISQDIKLKELENQAELQKALLPYSQMAINADIAKNSGKEVREEVKTASQVEKSLNFIDEKFSEAKGLAGAEGGASAVTNILGVPTTKGNQLKGIGDSIILQLDAALGRELNSDVRNRILSLAPKFYDTDAELERKSEAMKQVVKSLSKATPSLDAMGVTGEAKPPTPPPGYELTGNKDASGNWGIRRVK